MWFSRPAVLIMAHPGSLRRGNNAGQLVVEDANFSGIIIDQQHVRVDILDNIKNLYASCNLSECVFQMLGLFPSQNAIAMGDKEYHSAVNIGATMKARYNNWRHQGW